MQIRSKMRLLALGLVLATAALVGPVIYWGYDTLVRRQQQVSTARLAAVEARRFSAALAEVEHDVALLQALPALDALRDRRTHIATALSVPQLEGVLSQVFAAMASAKPHYVQIRLIGVAEGGRERVRVDRIDGRVRPVGEDGLQSKGHRPYFTSTIGLDPAETFVSRIELNREHGHIEQPEWGTLRIARAVRDSDDQPFGVLIVNLDFDGFADELFRQGAGRGVRHFVANADGFYLMHPDPARTYGFDRGHDARAQSDVPRLAPLFAVDGPERMQLRAEGHHIAWQRVHLPASAGGEALFVGVAVPDDARDEASIATRALLLTGLAVLVALFGGLYFSRRLVRPLQRVTDAAQAIGAGRRAEHLPVARADEIGVLARAFEAMVEALGERDRRLDEKRQHLAESNAALEQANRDLEQFAHVATHDLREPARRAAGISDLLLLEEEERLSPEGVEMLERLQGVTENMLARIADFRVLAGIGSGRLVRVDVDLDGLLDGVLDESALGGVSVTRDPLPVVRAYPELVALLYRTLIADAVRRAEGAPIRLHFGVRPEDGGALTMRIEGYGLSPDALGGIFTRMARLGDEGLGLSVCRRVVDRHAGWIRVASEGLGVEFTFNLGEAQDERNDSTG